MSREQQPDVTMHDAGMTLIPHSIVIHLELSPLHYPSCNAPLTLMTLKWLVLLADQACKGDVTWAPRYSMMTSSTSKRRTRFGAPGHRPEQSKSVVHRPIGPNGVAAGVELLAA
jgi:hypothetical protein